MLHYGNRLVATCVCLFGGGQVVYSGFIGAFQLKTAACWLWKQWVQWEWAKTVVAISKTKTISWRMLKHSLQLRGTADLVIILCGFYNTPTAFTLHIYIVDIKILIGAAFKFSFPLQSVSENLPQVLLDAQTPRQRCVQYKNITLMFSSLAF